jgi:broad specificity phosphatase PhoE
MESKLPFSFLSLLLGLSLTCGLVLVFQELGIPERNIHVSDELQEQSQGEWEGRPRAEIFTPEFCATVTSAQPDFCAPGGESQRQVEARMSRFVDQVVKQQIDEAQGVARTGMFPFVNPRGAEGLEAGSLAVGSSKKSKQQLREDELSASLALLDLRNKEAMANINGDGRSRVLHHPDSNVVGCSNERSVDKGARLQEVSSFHASEVTNATAEFQERPAKVVLKRKVALFGHGMAIKCLLRGLLQSDASMTHKIFIENTSITLVKFTLLRGWHITKVNDTAHLILARKNRVAEPRGPELLGGIYRYSS